jgi:hypothetical protein
MRSLCKTFIIGIYNEYGQILKQMYIKNFKHKVIGGGNPPVYWSVLST